MDENAILEQIVKRLDVLIALQLEKPLSEKPAAAADRIWRLSALGLPAAQIAGIMGKSTNYVTATLSQRKKATRKKGGS